MNWYVLWSSLSLECTGDENQGAQPITQDIQDPLEVPEGPITRSRAKKIKDAMNGFVQKTLIDSRHGCSSDSTL